MWPGPWEARPDPSNPTGDWLVTAPSVGGEHVAVCAQVNAPLIAAAPEMRDALELAEQALSEAVGHIDPQWSKSALVAAKVAAQASRLALAKANRGAA